MFQRKFFFAFLPALFFITLGEALAETSELDCTYSTKTRIRCTGEEIEKRRSAMSNLSEENFYEKLEGGGMFCGKSTAKNSQAKVAVDTSKKILSIAGKQFEICEETPGRGMGLDYGEESFKKEGTFFFGDKCFPSEDIYTSPSGLTLGTLVFLSKPGKDGTAAYLSGSVVKASPRKFPLRGMFVPSGGTATHFYAQESRIENGICRTASVRKK